MRGIAAQSHFRCSHALWLLVLLHQACFDAAPELLMTLLPAPIQRNCAQPWPTNFGCGATIQPLVASRRATLQGGPSRYSNSTMYCVNAWCDSPIIKCSTLSMGLAMRIWMCQFQKIIVVLCFMTVNCFVENVLGCWNYGRNQEQRWTFFDFSMGVTPNWRTEVM